MHWRVSMNAFRCAFSLGQCVNTPAKFVHNNATIVLPIYQIPDYCISDDKNIVAITQNERKLKKFNFMLKRTKDVFWWILMTCFDDDHAFCLIQTMVVGFGHKFFFCAFWKLPRASQQQLNANNSNKYELLTRVVHRRGPHANESVTLYRSYKQISMHIHWLLMCSCLCQKWKFN